MTWTVACFCGATYRATTSSACPNCGTSLPDLRGQLPRKSGSLGSRDRDAMPR